MLSYRHRYIGGDRTIYSLCMRKRHKEKVKKCFLEPEPFRNLAGNGRWLHHSFACVHYTNNPQDQCCKPDNRYKRHGDDKHSKYCLQNDAGKPKNQALPCVEFCIRIRLVCKKHQYESKNRDSPHDCPSSVVFCHMFTSFRNDKATRV